MDTEDKRTGRPYEGPQRKVRCANDKWAKMQLAAALRGAKTSVSDILREGGVKLADEIIREHLEALRSLELTDEMMKKVAAEYLASQEDKPAQ